MANEEPFEMRIRKGDSQVSEIKWSFELSFRTVRNFIDNIVIANINSVSLSNTGIRKTIKEILSDRPNLSEISSFLKKVIISANDTDISDVRFCKNIRKAVSKGDIYSFKCF